MEQYMSLLPVEVKMNIGYYMEFPDFIEMFQDSNPPQIAIKEYLKNSPNVRYIIHKRGTGYQFVVDRIWVRHGYWVLFYKNGNIESEGNYYLGHKEGIWKTYYYNEKRLYSIHTYVNNIKHGPCKLYFWSGGIMAEGEYLNNVRNDVWNFYYNNSYIIRKVIIYQNGIEI